MNITNITTRENLLIIILLILILSIFLINITNRYNQNEYMVNISPVTREVKWARDPLCRYAMTQAYTDILKEYSINETTDNDWAIYFPCSYNNNRFEIGKIKPTSSDQRIFIVTNTDEIASKSNLWKNLVKMYGRDKAKIMAPNSYSLNDPEDRDLFEKEYNPNMLYILKKNIQRQEGLKLSNNKDEILNGYKQNYVVAQELLQDPYMIKGRKTNMRFYVLLVCQNNEISAYVHNEGFVYYTKMPFKKNTLEFGPNVTTGYIERWIYQVNPLTHGDFKKYLDSKDRELIPAEKEIIKNGGVISKVVFDRIYSLISDVINAISFSVCKGTHIQDYISFQLFGVDIAVDDKLNSKIIEVNIGPNLATHDGRDSEVKHTVVRDILKVLKIVPDVNNGFIKIV